MDKGEAQEEEKIVALHSGGIGNPLSKGRKPSRCPTQLSLNIVLTQNLVFDS